METHNLLGQAYPTVSLFNKTRAFNFNDKSSPFGIAMTIIISIISLIISGFIARKQFILNKRMEELNTIKFVSDSLEKHKMKFFEIHQKTFSILDSIQINLSDLTTDIANLHDHYDKRIINPSKRHLRHIYYNLCTLIADSFYADIQIQPPEHLAIRLTRLSNTIPVCDFENEALQDLEDDIRYISKGYNKLYQLKKFRCLFEELYDSIHQQDNFSFIEKINQIISSTIEKLQQNKHAFQKLAHELSYINLINKLENVNLSNNQKLYFNICQLSNLLSWLDRGFYRFEKSEIESYKKPPSNITSYTVYTGSLFLLMNHLIFCCKELG